jgi:CRP/FNR family transcriptional regulator
LGAAANDGEVNPCGSCSVRTLAICAALEPEELRRLAEISQAQKVEAGQAIFGEDEPAENLYNVTSGTVKLYKLLPDGRRQITGFLFAGDFLGVVFSETYVCTAESVLPTGLCRFPRRRLEALFDELPRLQRRLFAQTANELALAQDQMLLLGRKTAREKICSFLLMLSTRAARRGHRDNPVFVPMSRADIADYLGLTTETVSRTFTQLKTTGVISLQDGNRVLIGAMDALVELAEGP